MSEGDCTTCEGCRQVAADTGEPWSRWLAMPIESRLGDASKGPILADWYENGGKREDWPKFQEGENWCRLIVALFGYPRGSLPTIRPMFFEQDPCAMTPDQPFAAWGSGSEFALGAMSAGADALVAVRTANRWSIYCGRGVVWYDMATGERHEEIEA